MKRVKLTTNLGSLDYPELPGLEGQEIDANDALAERLIANGHAVLIVVEPPAVVAPATVKPEPVAAKVEPSPASVPAKTEPEPVAVVAAAETPEPRPPLQVGRKPKEK